jgi:hypothetical protein
MPARDTFHDSAKRALANDGWTVTDDPLRLTYRKQDLYVDLGAEQIFAADKGPERIAVEVKSFLGPSDMADLELAVGQFLIYEQVMAETHPGRTLHLAVRLKTYRNVFEGPIGGLLLERSRLRLLVFDEHAEAIVRWRP